MSDFFDKYITSKLQTYIDQTAEQFISKTVVPPVVPPVTEWASIKDQIADDLNRSTTEMITEAFRHIYVGFEFPGYDRSHWSKDPLYSIPDLSGYPILEAERRFREFIEPHGIKSDTPLFALCRKRANLPPLITAEIIDESA